MPDFQNFLKGGDLRSIGRANEIVPLIKTQMDFDNLFECLNHSDRIVVMRTADIIEKITIKYPDYLQKHKNEILFLSLRADHKELKWHLALLLPRMNLTEKEFMITWNQLTEWATDKKESKIVRVNSIQGLADLLRQNQNFAEHFNLTLTELKKENIPSLNARIRKIKKA